MMALTHWKHLVTECIFKNPWWEYRRDRVKLHDGREGEYHYVHTGGSVMIVPVLEDGRILLVRQFRYLDRKESLEFPAGGMKEGEDPLAIAHKELVEETGCDGELEKIGVFNPCNGIVDETTHVYLAGNLKSSTFFQKDDTEEFEYSILTRSEVREKIISNEIYDGMTMAAWALARHRVEGSG